MLFRLGFADGRVVSIMGTIVFDFWEDWIRGTLTVRPPACDYLWILVYENVRLTLTLLMDDQFYSAVGSNGSASL